MTSTRKPSSKKTPRSSGPAGPSYPAPIQDTALNAAQRERALEEMSSAEGLDVLVVGGGVTGAGIALDAAARGLRTGIVEMGDWASGTSSWSSKLVHGGLRYLYQLNFALVHEALTERGRLLSTTAPHLVKAQPFLWPLKHHYERSYSAVGVGMYDALALAGSRGRKTVPIQRHLGRKGTSALAPSLDTSGLAGSIRFFDARVDDARLVIDLVRTAVGLGALAANRTKVTGFLTDERGHVHGARVTDLATGTDHEIRAKRTINAAGVWTEDVQDLATDAGGLKVLASKGIHIVVPKEAIDAETGVFLRTEKSVLFIIPWPEYWVIGTTDTPWDLDVSKPVATAADIDYINAHATSTPQGDHYEALALARLFGGENCPYISSTKGMTGHECWMAGASEVVYSILMMQNSFVAPNLNLENPDEAAANLNLVRQTIATPVRTVLSNSFGFGGTNSALILRAID